jgi:hypothetical protein
MDYISTSENDVSTQIWIPVLVYVLVTIIKKQLSLNVSIYTPATNFIDHPDLENTITTGTYN